MKPRSAAVLVGAGAAARAFKLGEASLWTDEASTAAMASAPWGELLSTVRGFEAAPPLHFVLAKGWLSFFSDAKTGLRSLSWLFGTAALGLFLRLAQELGLRRPGLALALGALSSFWVHAAQDGRVYSLLLLLACATSLLSWRLARKWSWPEAALYGAACAAGVLSHHAFALFLAADAVYVLWKEPRRALRWAAAWALPGAAVLWWLPSALEQVRTWTTITLLKEPLTLRQLASACGQMLVDAGYVGLLLQPASRVLGALALAAVGLAAWRARAEGPGPRRDALIFCLAHFAAPLAAARLAEAVLGVSLSQARYLVFVSPFLFLLLADLVPDRWRPAPAAAFAAGLALYFWSRSAVDPRLDLLSKAVRSAPEGLPVVHLHAFYYMPLRYYYLPERRHRLVELGGQPMDVSRLPGYQGRLAAGELERLGPLIVVDPEKRLFERKVGLSTGADLSKALF